MHTSSDHHGGPTVFMMLVERIVSNDEHLSRALVTRLNNFKLQMVPREDIKKAAAFIKIICSRLEGCGKIPPNADQIVFEIMMISMVKRFKSHLQTLDSIQDIKMSTYDEILRESVRYYTILYTGINQWLPLSKQPGVFLSNGGNSNNNGGGVNTLQGALPRGDSSSKPKTHDARGNIIDCTPPSKGTSTVRDSKTMAGKREYWCDTCGCWGSHNVDHHDVDHHNVWKQRTKEYYASKKRNNNNGGESTNPGGHANLGVENTNNMQETSATPLPTEASPTVGSSNLTMLKFGEILG
jgi:hypothetical protein